MINLTENNRKFLTEHIIQAFGLYEVSIALEKIYWHIINDIYDAEDACSVIVETLGLEQITAEKISNLMTASVSKKSSGDSASEMQTEEASSDSSIETSPVEPLRTMEGDIQKIHGYGAYRAENASPEDEPVHVSTQDDSLSKTKPVAERPTYTPEPEVTEPVEEIPAKVSGFTPREE